MNKDKRWTAASHRIHLGRRISSKPLLVVRMAHGPHGLHAWVTHHWMGQCSRRCWLACVWCAHGAWAAEFHCGASRWENACRGASAHSRARCAHCAWCMVGRVALRRIIWCAHVLEPQHSTVMHLGGDASAAEASACAHTVVLGA